MQNTAKNDIIHIYVKRVSKTNYFVNTGKWNSLFSVPNCVVDEYLKMASGQALKVLLYVLRNGNSQVSKNDIANAINIDDEAIDDAFNFWESVGVLSKEISTDISEPHKSEPVKKEIPEKKSSVQTSSERFNLRPAEIAERINNSEDIKTLFMIAESTLGRLLTNTDHRSLIWIHEYLGLNIDVILMLIQYCVSIGKDNLFSIEKIAFTWQEHNVSNLDDAQKEIQRMQQYSSYENKVLIAFGISNKPSVNQQEIINEWYNKGITIQLLEHAYNRTMDSIGKLSFPYINSIILSWNEKNISNVEEVLEYEKNTPPPKRTFTSKGTPKTPQKEKRRSYDISQFDKFAINYEEIKKAGG